MKESPLIKKTKALVLFMVATVIGFLDSLWLIMMHLNKSYQNGCSINSFINCTAINHPVYSKWFGVPVSYFAVLVFVGIGFALYRFMYSQQQEEKNRAGDFISLMVVGSLFAMIYFSVISLFVLKAFCV